MNMRNGMNVFCASVLVTGLVLSAGAETVQTLTWSGTVSDAITLPEGDTVVQWTDPSA